MLWKKLPVIVVLCVSVCALCDSFTYGQTEPPGGSGGGGGGSGGTGTTEIPVIEEPVNPWEPSPPADPDVSICYTTENKQCRDVVTPTPQTWFVDRECRGFTVIIDEVPVIEYKCTYFPAGQADYEKQIRTDIEVPWVKHVNVGGWRINRADDVYCVAGYKCECEHDSDGLPCFKGTSVTSHESKVVGFVVDLLDPCPIK
jgi:hypothetical protein